MKILNMMDNKKLKVVILAGGPSSEYKVSLRTADNIARKLDKSKYVVEKNLISKNGKWEKPVEKLNADVVFIAMHGQYGEDGTVQEILEKMDIPYTGSGVTASKLGMDKLKSIKIFQKNGLIVPKYYSLDNCVFPSVIKPVNGGSSVGVVIVKNKTKLINGLKKISKYDKAVIQEYVTGKELTCGVLDDGRENVMALLPTEIIPKKSDFFDYNSKYITSTSKEITPPDLPKNIIKDIQNIAVRAHKIIGCSGMSRTDMILKGKKIYVLEINTIPGMTETSLLPQGAMATGISFPELLDRIIKAALNKFSKK